MDAERKILRLLDNVAAGDVVEITRHDRAIARLVPVVDSRAVKGLYEDRARTAVDEAQLFSTGSAWGSA